MNNYRAGEEVKLLDSDEDDPPDDSDIENSSLEKLINSFEIRETTHSSDYMLDTIVSPDYYENSDYLSQTTTSANTYYEKNEYETYSNSSSSVASVTKIEDVKEYFEPENFIDYNIKDEIEKDMFALTGLCFDSLII